MPPPYNDPLAQANTPPPKDGLFAQPPADVPPIANPQSPIANPQSPLTPMQRRIILAVTGLGGRACIWEVARLMDVPDHCISQRFSELVKGGHLVLTGDKKKRPISDRPCAVYALPQGTSVPPTGLRMNRWGGGVRL